MNVQQSTFERGDWIVHANYGVGQVRELEKKELDGQKRSFYRVFYQPLSGNIVFMYNLFLQYQTGDRDDNLLRISG